MEFLPVILFYWIVKWVFVPLLFAVWVLIIMYQVQCYCYCNGTRHFYDIQQSCYCIFTFTGVLRLSVVAFSVECYGGRWGCGIGLVYCSLQEVAIYPYVYNLRDFACFNCIFIEFVFLCTCILFANADKSATTSIRHYIIKEISRNSTWHSPNPCWN